MSYLYAKFFFHCLVRQRMMRITRATTTSFEDSLLAIDEISAQFQQLLTTSYWCQWSEIKSVGENSAWRIEQCFQRLVCLLCESVARLSSLSYSLPFTRRRPLLVLLLSSAQSTRYGHSNRPQQWTSATSDSPTAAQLSERASVWGRCSPVICTADCWLRRPRVRPGTCRQWAELTGHRCQSTLTRTELV